MPLDYKIMRRAMVETQLVPRSISDKRVLDAFRRVPREKFVPENMQGSAYDDCALEIGEGQTISQPYMVAIMTEKLELNGSEKVLEIGTGSGYQTAILAELCKKVYTLERIPELAEKAKKILGELGYTNIEFIVGDGTRGYSAQAPYDRIMVTAAAEEVPPALIEQLAEGGKLVMPVGERYSQVLTVVTKNQGKLEIESSIGCVFVPLVGA